MHPPRYTLLAAILALTPLANDLYLPAMGLIAADMGSDLPTIQSSLAIYTLAFAFFNLLLGPVIDRFGRRPILLAGLLAFVLSSVLCGITTSSESFLIARFIQGAAGAAAAVVIPAILRDHFRDAHYVHATSSVALLTLVVPLLAPIAGGYISTWFGWPWIFHGMAIFCVILLPFAHRTTESLKSEHKQELSWTIASKRIFHFLKTKEIRHLILCNSFSFAGLFCFLTEANQIYIQHYKVAIHSMGYFAAVNVIGLIILTRYNQKRVRSKGSASLLKFGIYLQLIASALLIIAYLVIDNVYVTCGFLAMYMSAVPVIGINTQGMCLNDYPHLAGSLSSLLTTARNAIGALFGMLVSFMTGPDPIGTFVFMAVCSIFMAIMGICALKNTARPDLSSPAAPLSPAA